MLASGPNPQLTTYTVEARTPATGVTGLRLEALLDPSLPKQGPGRDPYGHFRVTSLQVFAAPLNDPAKRTRVEFTEVKGDGNVTRGDLVDLTKEGPATYARRGKAWVADAVREGWRVPFQLVLVPKAPVGFPGGTVFTVEIGHEDGTLGQGLGRFRLSTTDVKTPLQVVAVNARTRAAIEVPLAARTEAQAKDLATQFRALSPQFEAERAEVARIKKALDALKVPTTLVMEEKPSFERPSIHLRERGAFTAPGELVFANTPSALPPLGEDLPPNRLGLARWLVGRDNPLTARVMVNRLWEALYGRGLVETSEDFGTMGSEPSHPALLDWLAVEFMDQGWSTKKMLRTLVLSATYRQDSSVSPALQARDPYNRLLARGPRFRMEAEMVRDVALTASGQLSPQGRRAERVPAAAAQHLGQPLRQLEMDREHRRGPVSTQPLHVPAAHGPVPDVHDLRRHQPRVLHGAPCAHEHAAAGAGHAQRRGLLRARARAGGTHAQGGRADRGRTAGATASAWSRAACRPRRNWIGCAPSTRRRRRATRPRPARPPRPSTFRRTPGSRPTRSTSPPGRWSATCC